ncbi:N-acetylglucosamine kinase, partial [Rhizobium johnstonii]
RVLNDVDGAHLGAFAGEPGILILSGTGSMAWVRNSKCQSARTGGWGDLIGDAKVVKQGLCKSRCRSTPVQALADEIERPLPDPMAA